jgi:SAM-dependent methyltransferase
MATSDSFCDRLQHAPKGLGKLLHNPPSLKIIKSLSRGASVLDIGCSGFRQRRICILNGRSDLCHFGVDHPNSRTGEIPEGFTFKHCNIDIEKLPFEDDKFDMVVGSHVIEHLANPLFFFSESIRVCKPGGWVSIEAPSEVSVMLPGFPFQRDGFYSTSFFDDPTHIGRPWTTQAFYRLAKAFDLSSIHVSKDFNLFALFSLPITLPILFMLGQGRLFQYTVWKAVGWNARLVAQKPICATGKIDFSYILPMSEATQKQD